MLLHVFAHVDAHHRLLAVEQLGSQGLGELGFTDASGAQEQETGDRPIRIGEARAGTLNRIGHGGDGLLLANHPLVQFGFEMQQLFHLRLHQLAHRNAGPLGNHLGNVLFGDLLAQQVLIAMACTQFDLLGRKFAA